MTDVSIIIPVYNVEKYLPQCLDSIASQKFSGLGEVEVIFVDDGSTDNSGTLLDLFRTVSSETLSVKVIHKENGGVAAARNTGIGLATGKWLYFMDSDDWLFDDAIKTILTVIRENSDADILLFDGEKNWSERKEDWRHFEVVGVFDKREEILNLQRSCLYFPLCEPVTYIPLAAPWDKVFNRRLFDESGLIFCGELKVLDDMVFNMEAFYSAKKVVYIPEKIYHYRFVDNSITHQFKKNRIDLDYKVWTYIWSLYDKKYQYYFDNDEATLFVQTLYLRIIKSFAIALNLSLFHPDNGLSGREQLLECKRVCNLCYYKEAFRKVIVADAEWKLRVVVLFARLKCYRGLKLLSWLQRKS